MFFIVTGFDILIFPHILFLRRKLEAVHMNKPLIAAILMMWAPVLASAETLRYHFDVRLGIGKIGEMQVLVENTGTAYSALGSLYTTGLVGAFYNARYDSYAEGRVTAKGLRPVRFTSTANEQGNITTSEITYSGNRVVSVEFSSSQQIHADATSQKNTIDPMSLIYQLVRPVSAQEVCTGSYDLFDGIKRMTVSYTNLKRYNDERVECDVSYSGTGQKGGVSPSAVVFTPGDDGQMYIDRFIASTSIGNLAVSLRK